ncbi:MAG: ankyrin repeat domain-containing protein, partial [Bacteroidota bacterium]
ETGELRQGKPVVVGGRKQVVNTNSSDSKVNPIKEQATILQAVREGNTDFIAKMIDSGKSVNARYSTRKYTLLHYAIKNNQFEIVKLLLDKGADKEMVYDNQTPLMYAIKNQHTKIINLLIGKGASINALNDHRQSALFYVAKYGTINNARLLLDKGAKADLRDSDNLTAYDFALKNQNGAVASFLKSL